ncbi:MAG TPA: Smr/MutS family protein [Thermoanaerobaculia bacterium]|nr:Smr/MutS family protein [Thermoanaerobaculia bacterium]
MRSSLQEIEFDRILTLVAAEAKSGPGKDAIARRHPLPTVTACENAQADLADMRRFVHTEGLMPLAGLTDLGPLLARDSVLELEESWQVVRAVRATQAMREAFTRTEGFLRLAAIATAIPQLDELVGKLNKFFTRDGKLREDASAELRAIRKRVSEKRNAVQRVLNDVMNKHGEAIQEQLIVMRGDRYCIPVRTDHRNAIPGILHERSGSGASVFIEPMQAIELNNDLADLLLQEREEIARILRFISQLIADAADDIRAAVHIAGELDALQACAIFADTVGASRPSFNNDRRLHLIAARHPLLDERVQETDQPVVPVTVELSSATSALIISGPNAGGKTVALKTTGLLVAMAMSGLPLPAADGSMIPVVDAIDVLVGDDQSVTEHLSTFSAYLVRLKRVISSATERSLVLLDELGAGTDPEEGAALAAAVIEHFLERGALLIVTTHLSSVKSFAMNDARVLNASMEFDTATGKSTYRLIAGIPGRSRAIEVAQMIGLPSPIIDRARERLGPRYVEVDQLVGMLQNKMTSVLEQSAELEKRQAAVEEERQALETSRKKFDSERARVGSAFREELERLRDDVSRQVAAEIKNLRANANARQVVTTLTKPIDQAIEFLPEERREVRVGGQAEHRKFKVRGVVESIDGKKAVLNVSGKRMTLDVKDLLGMRDEGGGMKIKTRGKTLSPQPSALIPETAELNLIGQRVDDALEASDKFLDRALLEGKQAVRIIHGFGTGALRKAVRDHLRKHPAVKSWRPGNENEGGDGATVAVLDES